MHCYCSGLCSPSHLLCLLYLNKFYIRFMSFDMSCSWQLEILRLRTERAVVEIKENKMKAKSGWLREPFDLSFIDFCRELEI